MQTSFPILEYSDYGSNISTQSCQKNIPKEQEINIEEYEKEIKTTQIAYAVVFVAFILGLLISFVSAEAAGLIFFLLLCAIIVLVKNSLFGNSSNFTSGHNYADIPTPKYFQNGKITFEDEGIRFTQKDKDILYKYNKMTSLNLFYSGISVSDEYKLNSLQWEVGKKKYEYLFLIGSYYSRNQLIYALKYLYQKEIPIKEWSEYSEALHLLSLPVKSEPSKEKNDKPIDEKYLKMIDEIGKDDEKLGGD